MKKQLASILILFIATGAMVSFSSLRKAAAEKAADAKAKATTCTCNNVDPNTFAVRVAGCCTDIFTWNEPAGSSSIDYYNVGGYWSCGPGFGPIYAYGTATEMTIQGTCNHGTMSLITYCNNGTEYCNSGATFVNW
ncbi:MAG TPA: hypothetical protein VNW04_22470 [Puia sp.]|nr:hypothetical protein [Puia sp.]